MVALALLIGCNGDVPTVAPTPVSPQASAVGALPPAASDTAGTGFYDFMQQTTWAPKTTVEMCTNSFFCFFGLSGKVKVDLDVPLNSYLVDTRTVDSRGVLLVRAINKGSSNTGHYKFRPGYIYALVAYPDSAGATTSHWVLKETDTTTHLTTTVKGISGPFHPCWDSPPATVDSIGLFKCREAHASSAAVKKASMGLFDFIEQLSAVAAAAMAAESPVWKSCPSGCCTLAAQ